MGAAANFRKSTQKIDLATCTKYVKIFYFGFIALRYKWLQIIFKYFIGKVW